MNLYFHEFCDLAKLAHFLDPYETGFVKRAQAVKGFLNAPTMAWCVKRMHYLLYIKQIYDL